VDASLAPPSSSRWNQFLDQRASLAKLVRLLVGNPDDAADLLQDVSLLILNHPTGPRDPTCFPAWCRALARNVAANHWRAANRRAAHTLFVDPGSVETETGLASPELMTVCREQLGPLRDLDAPSLELLIRRHIFGETATELARSYHCSPTAIRMKLKRLRRSARDAIVDAGPEAMVSDVHEQTTLGQSSRRRNAPECLRRVTCGGAQGVQRPQRHRPSTR
jgi:DNA-directed RNA polymerase specialized sigma24 family protein